MLDLLLGVQTVHACHRDMVPAIELCRVEMTAAAETSPAPMATPTSAVARAKRSLMPSPQYMQVLPSPCSHQGNPSAQCMPSLTSTTTVLQHCTHFAQPQHPPCPVLASTQAISCTGLPKPCRQSKRKCLQFMPYQCTVDEQRVGLGSGYRIKHRDNDGAFHGRTLCNMYREMLSLATMG